MNIFDFLATAGGLELVRAIAVLIFSLAGFVTVQTRIIATRNAKLLTQHLLDHANATANTTTSAGDAITPHI